MKRFLAIALLITVIFVGGCEKNRNKYQEITNHKTGETQQVVEEKKAEITLFYANLDATGLVAEVRSASNKEAKDCVFVLNELIGGTLNSELVNVIPPQTKVNSATCENGICTVDLSADFISKNGTASEQMAIYSVVNTLCSMDGIDKVQFIIDGKKIMIFGSYIFDQPFEADMSIVK